MSTNAYAFAGAFTTAGTSPDGDTLRFRPDHPHHLDALNGCDRLGWSDDTVHVRLDAIDAPELHYEGERQRRSATARTRLLRRLGFTNVTLYGDYVDHAPEPRGWLVAREADLRGRVIGFVYRAADLDAHEGPIAFDANTALASANADMLRTGAAYALFYATLPSPIRTALHSLAIAARRARRGVWSQDSTRAFRLRGLPSIGAHGALVLPKLFRRCVTFYRSGETGPFVRWLRAMREHDDALSLAGHRTRFSALLSATGDHVHVEADPLEMVFEPRGG